MNADDRMIRSRGNLGKEGQSNTGCIFFLLIVVVSILLVAITNKEGNEEQSEQKLSPLNESSTSSYVPNESIVLINEAKAISVEPNIIVSKDNLSSAYKRGYDRGYDDGEDDAVNFNGYEASFDDSNHYKGQQQKDYEEGYEDGYETGYYDNAEGDD